MRKLNLFYPRAGLWKLMLWTFVLSLFAFQPTYGQSLLYATDFENGLDSSTIQGNGALIDAGDSHGTVFHNAAGGQAIRTNYLILPDNIFADLETAATNELTVSFWVNKGTAVDYYWTPLFTAYGAAPNPDNTSPMFTLQSRGWTQVNDGAGNWCDYSAEQKNFGTESTGWIDDGNWHHYAASITSTGTIIYIDGVPTHSWTIDGTTAAGGVNGLLSTGSLYTYITLGGNQSWNWGDPDPAFYFDNLKIYDGALSAGQVTALRDFDDINASVLAVSATEMFLDDVYSSATFTVDGLNLDNDVTITAPTGLTVSPATIAKDAASNVTVTVTFDGSTILSDVITVASGTMSESISVQTASNADCYTAIYSGTNLIADPTFSHPSLDAGGFGGWGPRAITRDEVNCGIGSGLVKGSCWPDGGSMDRSLNAANGNALVANTSYRLRAMIKNENQSSGFQFQVEGFDGTASKFFPIPETSGWEQFDASFKTGATVTEKGIYFNSCTDGNGIPITSTSDEICYIDNYELIAIPDTEAGAYAVTIEDGSVKVDFNEVDDTYTVKFSPGMTSVTPSLITIDPDATVTGNDPVDVSGGSGTSTLVVTARDNSTTKTYTINYERDFRYETNGNSHTILAGVEQFIEDISLWSPGDEIIITQSETILGTVDIFQEVTIMGDPLVGEPSVGVASGALKKASLAPEGKAQMTPRLVDASVQNRTPGAGEDGAGRTLEVKAQGVDLTAVALPQGATAGGTARLRQQLEFALVGVDALGIEVFTVTQVFGNIGGTDQRRGNLQTKDHRTCREAEEGVAGVQHEGRLSAFIKGFGVGVKLADDVVVFIDLVEVHTVNPAVALGTGVRGGGHKGGEIGHRIKDDGGASELLGAREDDLPVHLGLETVIAQRAIVVDVDDLGQAKDAVAAVAVFDVIHIAGTVDDHELTLAVGGDGRTQERGLAVNDVQTGLRRVEDLNAPQRRVRGTQIHAQQLATSVTHKGAVGDFTGEVVVQRHRTTDGVLEGNRLTAAKRGVFGEAAQDFASGQVHNEDDFAKTARVGGVGGQTTGDNRDAALKKLPFLVFEGHGAQRRLTKSQTNERFGDFTIRLGQLRKRLDLSDLGDGVELPQEAGRLGVGDAQTEERSATGAQPLDQNCVPDVKEANAVLLQLVPNRVHNVEGLKTAAEETHIADHGGTIDTKDARGLLQVDAALKLLRQEGPDFIDRVIDGVKLAVEGVQHAVVGAHVDHRAPRVVGGVEGIGKALVTRDVDLQLGAAHNGWVGVEDVTQHAATALAFTAQERPDGAKVSPRQHAGVKRPVKFAATAQEVLEGQDGVGIEVDQLRAAVVHVNVVDIIDALKLAVGVVVVIQVVVADVTDAVDERGEDPAAVQIALVELFAVVGDDGGLQLPTHTTGLDALQYPLPQVLVGIDIKGRADLEETRRGLAAASTARRSDLGAGRGASQRLVEGLGQLAGQRNLVGGHVGEGLIVGVVVGVGAAHKGHLIDARQAVVAANQTGVAAAGLLLINVKANHVNVGAGVLDQIRQLAQRRVVGIILAAGVSVVFLTRGAIIKGRLTVGDDDDFNGATSAESIVGDVGVIGEVGVQVMEERSQRSGTKGNEAHQRILHIIGGLETRDAGLQIPHRDQGRVGRQRATRAEVPVGGLRRLGDLREVEGIARVAVGIAIKGHEAKADKLPVDVDQPGVFELAVFQGSSLGVRHGVTVVEGRAFITADILAVVVVKTSGEDLFGRHVTGTIHVAVGQAVTSHWQTLTIEALDLPSKARGLFRGQLSVNAVRIHVAAVGAHGDVLVGVGKLHGTTGVHEDHHERRRALAHILLRLGGRCPGQRGGDDHRREPCADGGTS